MFKEVVFELAGGHPRSPHAAYLYEHPELVARMQILHATPESSWELTVVTGESDAIARFQHVVQRGPEAPMRGVEVVSTTPRSIQYIVKWDRPEPNEPSCSLEFLLHDIVGPDGILTMRIEGRRVEIKAAAPDGDKLLRFFREARRRLEDRFTVRITRMGELRPGWEPALPTRPGLREEDLQLVSFALSAGYYDNPKRCGVREIGDALGCSKSVIARRLRAIERRALESIVTRPEATTAADERPAIRVAEDGERFAPSAPVGAEVVARAG